MPSLSAFSSRPTRPARSPALLALLAFFAAPLSVLFASSAAPAGSGGDIKFLSGTGPGDAVLWDFYCTAGRRSGEWTKIRVPSCWEQEGFGAYYYGVWTRGQPLDNPSVPREQGRYRTTFTVPAAWKNMAVRIVFAGVMTDTEVLVNGKSAGPIHQGGFYQFHYDISALLNHGNDTSGAPALNTLEVNVSKESANASINKAERRGDYWTFGGIFRPVWLEARPAFHIARVAIDARADGTFTAEVFRDGLIEYGGSVFVRIFDAKNKPVGESSVVRFGEGETRATVRVKISGPRLWTAETPNLYTARFTYAFALADSAAHEYTQRFGFRTVEVRAGDGVWLNGKKIILKGVNRHSFRPGTGRTLSRDDCYADARLIKEMNMNAVRMSHYPPDSAFLAACDELGLYVINELAGWQGAYDTPTGARLAGELIRRDVNHPSILFWDNGNEGGWNTDNDGEFARWDPQKRAVLHPWALHGNINTKHYPKYDLLEKLCAGGDIFMPTEFLHGLYDGGHGAALRDYWEKMMASPVCAGGFLWSFADEGIARTDEGGRIDTTGNLAPDGIVGPHHERDGSFYAIKEIWSPVTLASAPDQNGMLHANWSGIVELQNNYAFTNLNQCTFAWHVSRQSCPGEIIDKSPASSGGTFVFAAKAPDVAPGAKGTLTLGIPHPLPPDSLVCLIAKDPSDRELWTWSWYTGPAQIISIDRNCFENRGSAPSLPFPQSAIRTPQPINTAPELLFEGPQILVRRGALALRFDKYNGLLISAAIDGKPFPIAAGPALAAYVRDNRRFTNLAPPSNDAKVSSGTRRAEVSARTGEHGAVVVEAVYPKPSAKQPNTLCKITWTIPRGDNAGVQLDYEYAFEGQADLLGVSFALPECSAISKRWFGRGPYRVYRNRLEGGVLGAYSLDYNDPLPGQTYVTEPEFKGYFRDWRWLELVTTGGRITLENNQPPAAPSAGAPYLGLWRPRDGVPMMMEFPDTDLTLLDVIPAQGSKFENAGNSGPQSATPTLSGRRTGSVTLHFRR